jgi:hypothetical protein
VEKKYSMVNHQSSQTKFPYLPGRFLGNFRILLSVRKKRRVQLMIYSYFVSWMYLVRGSIVDFDYTMVIIVNGNGVMKSATDVLLP